MKHCPSCKTNYADDTLQYCLQDGTQLVALPDSPPTVAFNETEAQTVVRLNQPQPPNWQPPPSEVTRVSPQFVPPPAQPTRSNTATAVLLTAFAMLLLF